LPQTVRFEYETFPVVMDAKVLDTINQLALESPDQDIRINDDGNMKVYVGPLNVETKRHWVYTDGRVILTEERVTSTPPEGNDSPYPMVDFWRAYERPLIPTT